MTGIKERMYPFENVDMFIFRTRNLAFLFPVSLLPMYDIDIG